MRARLLLLAALVLSIGACGGGDPPSVEAPSVEAPVSDAGLQHIHGLGINPADGAVMIATHTGLFEAADGEQAAARIGDSHQDTMGFTVLGADEFIGSGHPDAREDLPPSLGLIRSEDGGTTWNPVSLLGEADFHILRASGPHVYGVDTGTGLLLASGNEGRSWKERTPPGPLIDLAIDPQDPDHLVTSAQNGLFASRDGGRSWRPLARDRVGMLTWQDELVLVDAVGKVHSSRDAGRKWRALGEVGSQPAALASTAEAMLVALHDNSVHISEDGGRSWRERVPPA